ncbi:MAG: hypothetical protein V4736_00645 [Bdellovibrionota bacterium]
MSTDPLDDEIKSFILEKIDSVGQLEVLILLHKHPERKWTPLEVSNELRSNTGSAAAQMAELTKKGMINCETGPLYGCSGQPLVNSALIQKVITAYNERRVSVINLIYEKPAERIKNFADAFKLKRDE